MSFIPVKLMYRFEIQYSVREGKKNLMEFIWEVYTVTLNMGQLSTVVVLKNVCSAPKNLQTDLTANKLSWADSSAV